MIIYKIDNPACFLFYYLYVIFVVFYLDGKLRVESQIRDVTGDHKDRPELFLMGLTIYILVRALFRMFRFRGKIVDLVLPGHC